MYVEKITPRFNETDALGHINNNVYTIWFDLCRFPILEIFEPNLELKNMNFILAHTSTDFLGEVYFGEEVTIHTSIKKVGTSSIHFVHELYQNGKLKTIGNAVMVHFDHKIKKSIAIPSDVKMELEKHIKP